METLKIIKIGGNIINDDTELHLFLKDFATLKSPKILVHGGGKLATKLAQQMQVEVKMVDGRRITDAETLDIITMVYAGKINKSIVAQLQAHQCNAIGFSGADGNTIVSQKRPVTTIDYGFAGDVKQVNTKPLELLLKNNLTPVFCAMTHDQNGQLLNTNADTIASELAISLSEIFNVELYYCFEKNGVLNDVNNDDSVIELITPDTIQQLIDDHIIFEGMLPKIKNCLHAVSNRVSKVCIGKSDMLFNKNNKHTTITR
ncbi:acetylglutamate kinase [Psychroserpens algicola]|uniref:Acetylglutamate kinase n=1 Tax=Psychroserpens algicola TaxID=1719034 RepID=A0ABT0H7Y8_9FLAO|nr:acetylglutamate kinase [Psychroserpens algicola]MCK8480479.1 acetylglutamate kinase [Psychroserpens algicola]